MNNISYPFGKKPKPRVGVIDLEFETGYLAQDQWFAASYDCTINFYIDEVPCHTLSSSAGRLIGQVSFSDWGPYDNMIQHLLAIEMCVPELPNHTGEPAVKISSLKIQQIDIAIPDGLEGWQTQQIDVVGSYPSSQYIKSGWVQVWKFKVPIYYFLVTSQ